MMAVRGKPEPAVHQSPQRDFEACPDINANDTIQEFDVTKSSVGRATKACPAHDDQPMGMPKPRCSPRVAKRKLQDDEPSATSNHVEKSSSAEEITSFSIVEERPVKRNKVAPAKPPSKAKKPPPQKLAKLHIPPSPSKPRLSSDVATSPIEEPSAYIGREVASPGALVKPQTGSLLMALEQKIASHKSTDNLEPNTVKQRAHGPTAERSSRQPKVSRRHEATKRKDRQAKQKAQQQPQPVPQPRPATYAQCVQRTKKQFRADGSKVYNLFKGMTIYLLISDEDMEDVDAKVYCLTQYGARLLARFDPEVCTHVISADDTVDPELLYRLQVVSVDDVPGHIPILNWHFVVAALDKYIAAESALMLAAQKSAPPRHGVAPRLAPDLTSLESQPPDYFLPPQDTWHRFSACPEREARPKDGGGYPGVKSGQASEATDGEGSDYSSLSRATSPMSGPDDDVAGPSTRGVEPSATEGEAPGKGAAAGAPASDPLAEFYAQAKADHAEEHGPTLTPGSSSDIASWWDLKADENTAVNGPQKGADEKKEGSWWDRTEETEDEDDVEDSPVKKGKKNRQRRGYTCDVKPAPGPRGPCPNQDVVDTLEQLMGLHKVKPGDDHHWRAFSYQKSLKALRDYPRRIRSAKEAEKIPGVGKKTADKIMEIINTGNLERLRHEHTEDVDVLRLFQGIYGVGQATAVNWYKWGCRTLDDVRQGKGGVKLSASQKIGLKYYDDLQLRMPREEVQTLYDLIVPYGKRVDPKLELYVMGSFRRGKADCGDIDIMITRPTDDGGTHAGAMRELLAYLRRADILTEDLAVPEDPYDPECVYHGLCHLPHTPGAKQRRIDFLAVPWKSRGAALIYYTGDDIFNRAMRYKAGAMGYSLNQKGLYAGVVRDVHDRRKKLNQGNIIASETEEEIFRILGVPWQEPWERVRNN